MHRHYVTFYLALLMSLTVSAQTINLKGTVKNKAGSPISGASVTLAKMPNLKVTTGADGKFQLATVGTTQHSLLVPHVQSINLQGNLLEISLPAPSPVKVEFFDVKGKLLQKDALQNAPSGYYHLNVANISHAGELLVIRAIIGKDKMTFRYVPLTNGSYSIKSTVDNSVTTNGKLEKVAASVNDTLKVTSEKYLSKYIAITNYVQEVLDITLDSADGVIVQLDQTKQTIVGFGINATIMPSGKTLPWNQLFTLEGTDALGLSILRIGMNTDGNTRDVPSDYTKAKDLGAKIIGSCWSAPASWKDNNNENQGGHLIASHYSEWASRIATFAKKYNLYAMSIANESDFASCKSKGPPCTDDYASMVYTAKEMVAFVKEARKAFTTTAPNTKIIAPEASEWIHAWSTLSATGSTVASHPNSSDPLGCGCYSNDINNTTELAKCLQKCRDGDGYDYGHWLAKDTVAWNSFDILGVHEYDSQKAFPWPADVTGGVRTKEVWQTEMSGVMYWPEQGPNLTIENGVAVARWIQSALTIGEASAWCHWWYESYYSNDNEGVGIIQGSSSKAKRYYAMGNYSRYIRPGQKVVNIAGTDKLPAKVLLTAAKDDNGKVVIVAVNETTSAQTVPITIAGGTVPASFTPYVTADGNKNWAEGTAVTVNGGVLTVQLEKMSVTTFVSK